MGCGYVKKATIYVSLGLLCLHLIMQMSGDILSLSKMNASLGCLRAHGNALDKYKPFLSSVYCYLLTNSLIDRMTWFFDMPIFLSFSLSFISSIYNCNPYSYQVGQTGCVSELVSSSSWDILLHRVSNSV